MLMFVGMQTEASSSPKVMSLFQSYSCNHVLHLRYSGSFIVPIVPSLVMMIELIIIYRFRICEFTYLLKRMYLQLPNQHSQCFGGHFCVKHSAAEQCSPSVRTPPPSHPAAVGLPAALPRGKQGGSFVQFI